MTKQEYAELLKDPRWQKKRLQIMRRDKFKCKLCGDTKITLHVHHKKYINGNAPWEYENDQLITLCEDCHVLIEKTKADGKEGYIDLKYLKISNPSTYPEKYYFYATDHSKFAIAVFNEKILEFAVGFGEESANKILKFISKKRKNA